MTKVYLGYTVHTLQDMYGPIRITNQINSIKAYLGTEVLTVKTKYLRGVPVKVFMYHNQRDQKLSSVDSSGCEVTHGPILIFGSTMFGISSLPDTLVSDLEQDIEIRCVNTADGSRLTYVLHGLDDKMQVDLI